MQLHIIRHGQADNASNDFKRKLTEKGVNQANKLQEKLNFDKRLIIVSSSSNRTTQTAEIIFANQKIEYLDELYLASTQQLLKTLWSKTTTLDIAIIGHNPGLSLLINYFTDEFIELSTGQHVCIDFGDLSIDETSKSTGIILK